MSVTLSVTALIAALGIPSAITGLCFWAIQRKIEGREKDQQDRETARAELEVLTIQGTNAAIALSEAVAHAQQRGHTNGDMERALAYAAEVKHKQRDFLTKQGVNALLID